MAYYKHIWLLAPNGDDGLCGQPVSYGYFSPTANVQAWPTPADAAASVLTDGSDATRANFNNELNAYNPDFQGHMMLAASIVTEALNPPASAELVIYYRADRDHRIWLRPDSSQGILVSAPAVLNVTTTTDSPLGAGWRKAPLVFADGWGHQNIADLFTGEFANLTWRIEVHPPDSPSVDYSANVNSWVSELAIGYAMQVRAGAPCRIFPRDDRLGVGGARNYPPPRSRQGSSRGVGYY